MKNASSCVESCFNSTMLRSACVISSSLTALKNSCVRFGLLPFSSGAAGSAFILNTAFALLRPMYRPECTFWILQQECVLILLSKSTVVECNRKRLIYSNGTPSNSFWITLRPYLPFPASCMPSGSSNGARPRVSIF